MSGIRDGGEGVSYFCEREEEKYRCRDEKGPDKESDAFEIFPDDKGEYDDRHPKHGRYDAGKSEYMYQLKIRHDEQGR